MNNFIFYTYELESTFIPFLIAFILFKHLYRKNKVCPSKSYYVTIIIFALYIIGVFHFTGAGTLYNGLTYRLEIRQEYLNFIPFSNAVDIKAYLLNILLFIPLGILTPLIWKKMDKFSYLIGTGFAFSFLIEISQLLNNRRTDIDDLILNTAGAGIGYALYKIWNKCTKEIFQINDAFVVELPVYILVIFAGRFIFFNEMGLARLLYDF